MGIGLAWHIATRPDSGVIVWHNGGTGGYRTFSGYDPARRTGVVVLTNSNIEADDIGMHLLSPTFPLRSTKPVSTAQHKEISLPAATLDRYVGEYELAPAFHIVVTHVGDGLIIEPTGQGKLPIFAEKDTEFFLKVGGRADHLRGRRRWKDDSPRVASERPEHQRSQDQIAEAALGREERPMRSSY